MLRMRVNFAATVLNNGDVAVCGGQTAAFQVTNECEVFRNGLWARLPAMKIRRAALTVVQMGRYLFAFGGSDENDKPLKSIERLDLEKLGSQWEIIVPEMM